MSISKEKLVLGKGALLQRHHHSFLAGLSVAYVYMWQDSRRILLDASCFEDSEVIFSHICRGIATKISCNPSRSML